MSGRRPAALFLALGLAAGVAGCAGGPSGARVATVAASEAAATPSPATNGIDGLPSAKALAAVRKAYVEAPAVHLRGDITVDGDRMRFDLRQKGGDIAGSIATGDQRWSIIVVGPAAWITGNRAYLTASAGPDAARALKGKWLKVKRSALDGEDLAWLTDRAEFADLFVPAGVHGGGRTTLDGTPAFRFTDGAGGGLYVALRGQPYPLRLVGDEDDNSDRVDFLDYGRPMVIKAPPRSKVVAAP